MRKMRRKGYWAVAGEGSAHPHHSPRFVTNLPDGGFLVKQSVHLVWNDTHGDRCSSVSALVVEGLMNNAGEREVACHLDPSN